MSPLRGAPALALTLLVLIPLTAGAQDLTVDSSLPLQGASRDQTEAILRGERLALERAGGRVGPFGVKLVSLDDSTKRTGAWTPERVQANASRAARDPSAIAYLGEFNSGASALSIPVLNEAGIPQISPSNTAIGLTADGPGADQGEPDKYYPSGTRTFFRLTPSDRLQAAAIARLAQVRAVKRRYLVDDGEVYGDGVADNVRLALKARGITLAGRSRLGRQGRNATAIARRVRRSKAQAMVFGGITANGAPRLFNAVHRRNRRIVLVGSDGVAENDFARRLSRGARARTQVMITTLPPDAYAAPPELVQALRGEGEEFPDPYALFGYEAMSLALDAIRAAGDRGNDRISVLTALANTRDRDSVLGRYSFDRNGDTTLSTYGVYGVLRGGGGFGFVRAIDSSAP